MFTRQRVGVIPTCYGWFFADGRFLLFFPFLLSLFQRKCTFVLFSLDLSISVFLFFYCFIVVLGLIIKVLVIFNLVLELQCHVLLFFSMQSLFFWFLILFSLALLLKFY